MFLFRLVAIAIAVASVFVLARVDMPVQEADLRNAVNVLAGASATLLGFLVSAGALLYAVANTRLARNLQRTGHFQGLLRDLFTDAGAFLIALLVGLVCLFLPMSSVGERTLTKLEAGVYALVFTNALAYLLLVPVGWKMWLLLSSLRPETGAIE